MSRLLITINNYMLYHSIYSLMKLEKQMSNNRPNKSKKIAVPDKLIDDAYIWECSTGWEGTIEEFKTKIIQEGDL